MQYALHIQKDNPLHAVEIFFARCIIQKHFWIIKTVSII